jgi:P4 family phage/plasmid primase-like protien
VQDGTTDSDMTPSAYAPKQFDAPYRAAAAGYWARGWDRPLPLGYVSKDTAKDEGLTPGWHRRRKGAPHWGHTGYPAESKGQPVTEELVQEWRDDPRKGSVNIAIVHTRTMAFDVDSAEGHDTFLALQRRIGEPLPATYTTTARGWGALERHHVYRVPEGFSLDRVEGVIRKMYGGKLDILHAHHRYSAVYPSIHPSGESYLWYDLDGNICPPPAVDDLPELPQAYRDYLTGLMAEKKAGTGGAGQESEIGGEQQGLAAAEIRRRWDQAVATLEAALPGGNHDAVNTFAFETYRYSALYSEADVEKALIAAAVKINPAWTSLDIKTETDLRAARADAKERLLPYKVVEDKDFEIDFDDAEGAAPETDYGYTDAVLAGKFAQNRLAGRFHFTDALGWLRYDGKRWAEVSEKVPAEHCRRWVLQEHRKAALDYFDRQKRGEEVADKVGDDPAVAGWHGAQKANRLASFVRLAAGHEAVFADAALFDTQPELLNTPDGVYNMRTGETLPHAPGYRMTKITKGRVRLELLGDPLIKQMLYAYPEDTHDWVQIRAGEACTGYQGKELLILDGVGNNGKTGMTGGLKVALGGYAGTIPSELLLDGDRKGGATPEKMELRGLRFGYIEETPEDANLNPKMVKSMFDVEELKGRQLYGKFTAWRPTHSIILNTNHIPRVVDTDHGVWRRLKRIRCPYRFRDIDGGEALEAEYDRPADVSIKHRLTETQEGRDAILTWAVAGAKRFLEAATLNQAAVQPESVTEAVEQWRKGGDDVLGLLDGTLRLNPSKMVLGKEAFAAFAAFVESRGGRAPSMKVFIERIVNHSSLAGRVVYKQARTGTEKLSRPARVWLMNGVPLAREFCFFGLEWVPEDAPEADLEPFDPAR